MQSSPNDANVDSTDEKNIAAITVAGVANGKSINNIDQEQQLSTTREDRLNKNVNRLSSPRTLILSVLIIPSFVVELNYGIVYVNQCPIQPLINIFLIVHGSSSLINGIVLLIGFLAAKHIKRSPSPPPCSRRLVVGASIGQLIILIFDVAWLIAGQVWVFGAQTNGFQSSNSTLTTTFCQSQVFWTGFAIIIVTYAVWLILILVVVRQFIMKRQKIKQETAATTNERI